MLGLLPWRNEVNMDEPQVKEMRQMSFQPEIRAGENGKKMIAGYAVKWRQLSSPIWGIYLEKFERGAFADTLKERVNDIYAAWQHDVSETLGRSPTTLTVREDDTGLWYEIDPPTWADRHIESIERGDVRGSSFIFQAGAVEYDWESDPQYVIRTVKRAHLFEVSPVTLPAYPSSTTGVRGGEQADHVAEMIKAERARRQNTNRAYLERNRLLREI